MRLLASSSPFHNEPIDLIRLRANFLVLEDTTALGFFHHYYFCLARKSFGSYVGMLCGINIS